MNILLVALDTVRADHLGCYGYPRDTSPNMDALARQGVVLDRWFTPAIPTQPSFATIYSGQYPLTHGVISHGGAEALPADSPFFTENLQQAGLVTCAVDNLYSMRPWFARGYEFYIDPSHRAPLRLSVSGKGINSRALPWVRAHAREPFFLLVHYWDTHTPYQPPARLRHRYYDGDPTEARFTTLEGMRTAPLGDVWSETWLAPLSRRLWGGREIRDAEYVVALYDACVRYVDEAVGDLLSALEDGGVADDTLVIVTADHGEMMYRHGIFFDHHGLYNGNLRLPFIARWPGRIAPGRRRDELLETVSLAPTLLAAAGAQTPAAMEGASILALLTGEGTPGPPNERVVAAECTWQCKWCLLRDRRKLILAREPDLYGCPRRELYDLSSDPDELHDLAPGQPDRADEMEAELERCIAHMLERNHLDHDPLTTHGTTLGKRWAEGRF
jgi:arylsulfatase A-like enzyme